MPVQNHIHLSQTIGAGPENAPDTTWIAVNRLYVPTTVAQTRRTLTGKLRRHSLRSGGSVIRFENYQYTLRVGAYGGLTLEQRIAGLEAMLSEKVYLVDHFHPDDGTDHTAAVIPMYVENVGPFPPFSPNLFRFDVDIQLVDYTLE